MVDTGDFANDEGEFSVFFIGGQCPFAFLGFLKLVKYEVKMVKVTFNEGDVFGADLEGFVSGDNVLGNLHDGYDTGGI